MFRHLRDVIENNFVWVPKNVELLSLVLVLGHGAHDTSLSVLELGVSSELLPLFLILVFFCHT